MRMQKPAEPVPTPEPVAYSYVRFSTPEQAEGDSLRRQTEAAAAWCERNGVKLDTSLTLHDLGKSAFRGKHRDDKAALGAFIRLAEEGKIPPNSYLLIERLDRLTREDVNDALEMFLRLKKLVRIVQLSPVEVIHDRHSHAMQLMMALVELMRGRDESQAKSERGLSAWGQKRKLARQDGKLLTRRVPAWFDLIGGELRINEQRAKVIASIFKMSADGLGLSGIVRKLTADKVPAFGDFNVVKVKDSTRTRRQAKDGAPLGCGEWRRAYIKKILSDRRVLGEYTPRSIRDGADANPKPVAGYFPRIVDDDAFYKARAAAADRKHETRGRTARGLNLFKGLLFNAGPLAGTYYHCERHKRGVVYQVLIAARGLEGAAQGHHSFPYTTFERAILSRLSELDMADVLPTDARPDDVVVVERELTHVRAKREELGAELHKGHVAELANALRSLAIREGELMELLEDACEAAAVPLDQTLADVRRLSATILQKSRLKAIDAAPDQHDVRLRLQAALRRLIDGIWILVAAGKGPDRLATAQVWFRGGGCRTFEILHMPPRGNRNGSKAGRWGVMCPHVPDIRQREAADAVLAEMQAKLDREDEPLASRFALGFTEEIAVPDKVKTKGRKGKAGS